MHTVTLTFPELPYATVELLSVPHQGDLFDVDGEAYEVDRVIYELVDFRRDEPERTHQCKIQVNLRRSKE